MAEADRVAVIGAGPAGLAAALELVRHGIAPIVFERNERIGGLARTIWYKNYGFDLGPHRFFTKNREIEALWTEILGEEFREVPRLTRIFYNGRFFFYPLRPLNTFFGLGPWITCRAVMSYGASRIRRKKSEPANFEEWIVQNFGRVLFSIFFRPYTEKVWGIPCAEIGKEWASQRVRGLNLTEAIRNAIGLRRRGNGTAKSLVERFYYPRLGAGQMYEEMATRIQEAGAQIRLSAPVTKLITEGDRVAALGFGRNGEEWVDVSHVFASSPITSLVGALTDPPPAEVLEAARALRYRAHLTVNLIANRDRLFPDNWVYIHSPDVATARVTNYNNFSPDMVARPGTSALSVEYFCFKGDDLWRMTDADLIALAGRELERVALCRQSDIEDGFIVREANSYPTYYLGHGDHFDTLYRYLARYRNLSLIGRAGMYRYNNQDHAMLTGLYAYGTS